MKKISSIALSLMLLFSAGCDDDDKKDQNQQQQTQQQTQQDQNQIETKSSEAKVYPELTPEQEKMNTIIMKTNMGNIKLKLMPEKAPKTVNSFKRLVSGDYYNGIIFHRVIDGFMIQGGDPTGTGRGGESAFGKSFEDEVHEDLAFDKKGLLAMANAGPNTNGSQFFITLVPTPHLNMRHTIFGEVVEGMDIVEKIGKVETDAMDKPKKSVVMEDVSLAP